MPDRWSRSLGVALAVLAIAALLAPGVAFGAPRPGESCPDTTPATTPAPGSTAAVCGEGKGPDVTPGGGAVDLSGILPFLAAGVVGAVIALGAVLLLLRRRALAPAGPADPGEWWTCPNCGRNNVIGTPRCYACGHWQG